MPLLLAEAKPRRPRPSFAGLAQPGMKDRIWNIRNPKAFNCLTLIHQFQSNQMNGLDERVQARSLQVRFWRPKGSFFGDGVGYLLFAAFVSNFNASLCDLMQVWTWDSVI